MKKIVLNFNERLLEDFENSRHLPLFTVLFDYLEKVDAQIINQAKTQIEFDLDVANSNEEVIDALFKNGLPLNDNERAGVNYSIIDFIDSGDKKSQISEEQRRKEANDDFVGYVLAIDALRECLEKYTFGQHHAIDAITSGFLSLKTSERSNWNAPIATFTFAGPHQVGKTHIANITASFMQDNLNIPFFEVNKTDYDDEKFISKILNFVDDCPQSILIFNDVEYIDSAFSCFFKTIFTTGNFGNVDFRNVVFFFTTSLGKTIYNNPLIKDLSKINKSQIINALYCEEENTAEYKGFVDPVIVSCLEKGTVVMLNRLPISIVRNILSYEIENRIKQFYEKTNVSINCKYNILATLIMYMNAREYDLKNVINRFSTFFDTEMNDIFTQQYKGKPLLAYLDKIDFALDIDAASNEVKNLFADKELKCLVVTKFEQMNELLAECRSPYAFTVVSTFEEVKNALANNHFDVIIADPVMDFNDADMMPTNIADMDINGVKIVKYLTKTINDSLIYLLSFDSEVLSYDSLKSLMDLGCEDIIYLNLEDCRNFFGHLEYIRESIELASDVNELITTNKVLTYNSKQYIKDDGSMVIAISNLNLSYSNRNNNFQNNVKNNVKFSDIICDEKPIKILRKYGEYLMDPKKYLRENQIAPVGSLLYGRPGVGKKMLAKALANESHATLVEFSANDIAANLSSDNEVYSFIHSLFVKARLNSPSVLLLSDMETFLSYENSQYFLDKLVKAFSSEIQALTGDTAHPVILICTAACGFSEIYPKFKDLFDNVNGFLIPSKEGREKFIKQELENNFLTISDEATNLIVLRTYGKTYTGIKRIISYIAKRQKMNEISDDDVCAAFDEFAYGSELKINPDEALRISYHEIGHLLIQLLLGKNPQYVTIMPRESGFLGVTLTDSFEDKSMKRKDYLDEICCCLGGRVAEIIQYGDEIGYNTGASSDLESATWTAREMITLYAMGKTLAVYNPREPLNSLPKEIIDEINEVLQQQFEITKKLLSENKSKLDKLSEALFKKHYLVPEEFMAIFNEK